MVQPPTLIGTGN